MPALIRLLGSVPGAGFSTKRSDATAVVELDDAERRRVVDGDQVDRRLGAGRPVGGDEGADVEVGEHVAVGDDERVVDAGVVGGEADRPGGVERLGLDGVVERDAAAAAVGEGREERLGPEAERQRDVVDAAALEAGRSGGTISGTWAIGSIGLGMRVGERPEAGAEPADQHDGAHQPPVVVVAAAVVGVERRR